MDADTQIRAIHAVSGRYSETPVSGLVYWICDGALCHGDAVQVGLVSAHPCVVVRCDILLLLDREIDGVSHGVSRDGLVADDLPGDWLGHGIMNDGEKGVAADFSGSLHAL